MTALAVVIGLSLAIASPHLISLERASPSVAVATWFSALMLRAAAVAFAVIFAFVVAPATDIFHAVTHLCWHTVVPLVTTHLRVSGHGLADLATLLPVLVVLASATSVAVGIARATRRVRRLVSASIGPGPRNSIIVAGRDIVLAAAGIRRPRVIVSAGALALLDDAELGAGLDHEHGHIARHHRWVLVAGQLAHAVARPMPGSRTALSELTYHLERDADRFALDRHHAPSDLASAICKAAGAGRNLSPALSLAGGGAVRRVRHLLADEGAPRDSAVPRLVAAVLVGLTLIVLAGSAPVTLAAARAAASAPPVADCPG
jgi:Zn-dependent protease with chaperone function